ncbi:nitroreductase family protein [Rhodococcus sp. NPDC057529]|uniref:nitroreductase family protein n=1 Tax=Rhodococcus sp. NPDC057529 TaxID=3346158 RepID=UPI00366D1D84
MTTTTAVTVGFDLEEARRAYTPKAELPEVESNFEYDRDRFLRHSSTRDINPDPVALASFLTSAYHSLEKGLAMEVPRAGFGVRKIPSILAAIRELEATGNVSVATRGARGSVRSYVRFHDERGLAMPAHLEEELRAFAAESGDEPLPGGAVTLTRKEIKEATDFDYDRFIKTRYSVRHFTGEDVAPSDVRTVVGQALKSPRVCNRESRRIYAAYEPELRNNLLSYHHGNSGFGHKLGAVLVVAVDIREFDMIGERNQPWIDGGLFAMSLVYGFHAAGLGTCVLNWSEDREHDQVLRNAFHIPDNEVVITLIGVGHLPEQFDVAASPPPAIDDVLSVISPR